jgi:hypothetical protein
MGISQLAGFCKVFNDFKVIISSHQFCASFFAYKMQLSTGFKPILSQNDAKISWNNSPGY